VLSMASIRSTPAYVFIHGPITPPLPNSFTTTPRRQILIRHPHYPDSSNILLNLFAPDHPDGGLQYNYVLVICGIIAGNRWDGWFTKSKDGPPLKKQSDEILPKGEYFFHLEPSSSDSPYPIVPSFREWVFPHNNLPFSWTTLDTLSTPSRILAASSLTTALTLRDVSCRISGCTEGTQVAHICPRQEADWYQRNQMSRYHNSHLTSRLEDDTANAILLRADLHIDFDKPKFVLLPKSNPSSADSSTKFVTHLLVESNEHEFLYHNRALQGISQVSPELLFARLAWTIFPFLDDFLRYGLARYLSIAARDGSSTSTARRVEPEKCKEYSSKASRSRNPSPKKRGRRDGSPAEDAEPRTKRQRTSLLLSSEDSTTSSGNGALPETPRYSSNRDTPFSHTLNEADVPINELKRHWLHKERSRSDPDHTWEAEEKWANRIQREDNTMNQAEAIRLLEYYGGEFQH